MIKNWWLLALSGVLDAMYAALNFFTSDPVRMSTVERMGLLALAAGACTVAAGLWSFKRGASWLLVLNGLACTTLGLLLAFWRGPLAFRTIALLIVVMALSAGIYELADRRRRLLSAAGLASIGFALAFLAFVFHWIKLDPSSPHQTLFWLGSYFAFTAICMLWLAQNKAPL